MSTSYCRHMINNKYLAKNLYQKFCDIIFVVGKMHQEMRKGTLSSEIKIKDRGIVKMRLSVIQFEDNGSFVVYCPALNIHGCGYTEDEAAESLSISIEQFFIYTIHKKTLQSELHKLGWTARRSNKYTPPSFSTMLEKNKTLHRIINTRPFLKQECSFNIPAIC